MNYDRKHTYIRSFLLFCFQILDWYLNCEIILIYWSNDSFNDENSDNLSHRLKQS